MQDRLQSGITHHRAGRLAEAEAIYRGLLQESPDAAEPLALLGLIAGQRGQFGEAEDLLLQAIARAPKKAEYHNNLGEIRRRAGRLPEAEAAFREAAGLEPRNPWPWYNLGVALGAQGKRPEAIAAYRKALNFQPAFPEALNNLGSLLLAGGEFAEAIAALRRSLLLRPDHAETLNNLGMALWKQGSPADTDEALRSFEQAARVRPDFASAHGNLGGALRQLGRRAEALKALQLAAELDPINPAAWRELAMALAESQRRAEAVQAARRAVENGPGQAESWHVLGVVLAQQEALAEAIDAYTRALALAPGTAEWEFERAALADAGGTQAAAQFPHAPESFVRALFDRYALRFESHLVAELHYGVPMHLLRAVLEVRPAPPLPPTWELLDLGCGTGLVGEAFRLYARHITGVDLAPRMVEIARQRRLQDWAQTQRGVYDEVLCADALFALQQGRDRYDLITAGDVFIYVGGLEELIPAAAGALRPGGLLAFSLERHEGEGYVLTRQHRYAHALSYVQNLAHASGLRQVFARETRLRDDVPPGWIVVLERC